MTTIHDLLDQYARMARDTREKGLLLERLTKAYLTTDPTWTAHFDEVWLWQDWPGRDGKVDTGIDLVARESYGGGYCAIQCKFFDPQYSIQKGDIDSFFTASGKQSHELTSGASRRVAEASERVPLLVLQGGERRPLGCH